MIEMDCQLTRDGHIVIFHDERLKRTAGVGGTVKSKTLEQLKKLDVGQWKKKSFRGERVLTLEEVLEIVVRKSRPLPRHQTVQRFTARDRDQAFVHSQPLRLFGSNDFFFVQLSMPETESESLRPKHASG